MGFRYCRVGKLSPCILREDPPDAREVLSAWEPESQAGLISRLLGPREPL